jgi:predicted transcriptional regulator
MMAEKRTMTLNLSDAEMDVLEQLAARKDLNKTIVIRQALRLYQMVDQRLREGKKLFIEDELTKDKSEVMLF